MTKEDYTLKMTGVNVEKGTRGSNPPPKMYLP